MKKLLATLTIVPLLLLAGGGCSWQKAVKHSAGGVYGATKATKNEAIYLLNKRANKALEKCKKEQDSTCNPLLRIQETRGKVVKGAVAIYRTMKILNVAVALDMKEDAFKLLGIITSEGKKVYLLCKEIFSSEKE